MLSKTDLPKHSGNTNGLFLTPKTCPKRPPSIRSVILPPNRVSPRSQSMMCDASDMQPIRWNFVNIWSHRRHGRDFITDFYSEICFRSLEISWCDHGGIWGNVLQVHQPRPLDSMSGFHLHQAAAQSVKHVHKSTPWSFHVTSGPKLVRQLKKQYLQNSDIFDLKNTSLYRYG